MQKRRSNLARIGNLQQLARGLAEWRLSRLESEGSRLRVTRQGLVETLASGVASRPELYRALAAGLVRLEGELQMNDLARERAVCGLRDVAARAKTIERKLDDVDQRSRIERERDDALEAIETWLARRSASLG